MRPEIKPSDVREYRFTNGVYSFSILNLGCAVTSLNVPDRNGRIANVVLPYRGWENNPSVILDSRANFGLTVGRFANRIRNASFELDGKRYVFTPNEGKNLLHSGPDSIRFRLWNVKEETDGFTCCILTTEEQDGFPGALDLQVRFRLSENGVFRIEYTATPDADSPVNITNHSYFNLTGNPSSLIMDHIACFNSSRYAETDDEHIPTGKISPVDGQIQDFRKPVRIGDAIEGKKADFALLIDRPEGDTRSFTEFATVYDPGSGRVMTCHTDMPGFHFYAGGSINGECGYAGFSGLCLETEFLPDCVNHPEFTSCIVKAGETFKSVTSFAFSVK